MCVYKMPRLIDTNARSRLIRGKSKLLLIGRCIETEYPQLLDRFKEEYAILSVCLEEEHVNSVGFKFLGILARNEIEEVSILTTDGSMHCVQLHYMVEEAFKIIKSLGQNRIRRRHYVIQHGRITEVPMEAVKTSRFLAKVAELLNI